MDRSEPEYRRLANRFQKLSGTRRSGTVNEEFAECETQLLHHVRDRDAFGHDALCVLMMGRLPVLIHLIGKHTGDQEQTEDVAQQVMTSVLSAYHSGSQLQLKHGANSFYAYLYSAARREADRHRARHALTADTEGARAVELSTDPDDLPGMDRYTDPNRNTVEYRLGTAQFAHMFKQVSRHLPTRTFDLLFMAEQQGLSNAEVADCLGLSEEVVSVYRGRARKEFVDWFAALYVAREKRIVADGCAALSKAMGTWDPNDPDGFTAEVYLLVRKHTRGCTPCYSMFITLTTAKNPVSHLMDRYRALPTAAAPEALRRWLQAQRPTDDQHRRRSLAEVLTAWRSRTPSATPTAAHAADSAAAEADTGPAALLATGTATTLPVSGPARVLSGAAGRVQSLVATLTRIPAVSSLVQAAQNNPGLSRAAGVIITLVVIAGAALVASPPARPDAATVKPPAVTVTSPAATTPTSPGVGPNPGPGPSGTQIPTASPSQSGNANQPTTPATGVASPADSKAAPPPGHDFPVSFDATDLTNPVFGVVDAVSGIGATSLAGHQLQTLHLAAGQYILFSGFAVVEFAVTSTGTVDYGPASSFLAGRGTTTLVVRGVDVTVDAHELSNPLFSIIYVASNLDSRVPHTLRLLPGRQRFGAGVAGLDFTVTPDGTISYDPTIGFVTGTGTSQLDVHGLDVTVDAHELSNPLFSITYATTNLDSRVPHTLRLLPGRQQFGAGVAEFNFTLAPDGTISYDPTIGFVTGTGTSQLDVHGVDITIDAHELSNPLFTITYVASNLDSRVPHTLRLLPGQQQFGTGTTEFNFTVTVAGGIDYDPKLTFLTGKGTPTLTVHDPG